VGSGYGQHFGGRVDGSDAPGRRQPCGALGKDAAATADIEKGKIGRRGSIGLGAVTGADKVVTERVHEMEEPRGAMRIPPVRGEGVEV
jgi:hypothetical protein